MKHLKKIFALLLLANSFVVLNLHSKDDGRSIENVTFYSLKEEGSNERVQRNGILVLRPNAKATVLVLHGYTRDKHDAAPLRRMFLKNYNSFSFDFRAHGENSYGQRSTMGHDEVFDVMAAVQYLKSRPEVRGKPLFVFAFSMGAATAIEAQSKDPYLFDAMFLDTPFHSSAQIIKNGVSKMHFNILGHKFNIPGACYLESLAFNDFCQPIIKFLLRLLSTLDGFKVETHVKPIKPYESIKKINTPCHFVVCVNDKLVSYKDVVEVYSNHPSTAKIWISDGRWHCDSLFNDPEYYDEILNGFFEDVLNNRLKEGKEIVRSCLDEKE